MDTKGTCLMKLINSRIIDNQFEFIFFADNFGHVDYDRSVVYHRIPINILNNGKQKYEIGENGHIDLDPDENQK